MQIKDIIKESADLLGLNEISALVDSATEETEATVLNNAEVSKLYKLLKFSIQELCSNYVAVATANQLVVTGGTKPLNELDNFIRLIGVFDQEDKPVKYKIQNRALVIDKDGTYTIKYTTYPVVESLFDDVDYFAKFSPDVMIFGLCSYYCLANGMFEDFEHFHTRYTQIAEGLKRLRVFDLPKRCWE